MNKRRLRSRRSLWDPRDDRTGSDTDMIRTRGLTPLALKVSDPERAFASYQHVFGAVACVWQT